MLTDLARIGRIQITEDQAKAMLAKTPDRRKNSSRFFRSLHEKGLISYTEYLFFLCILTSKPCNLKYRLYITLFF